MNTILSDNLWSRVAGLKPKLQAHIDVCRHEYRGQSWYIFQDRAAISHYRCNASAHEFIMQMDGHYTVEECWQRLCESRGNSATSREEVIQLLAGLNAAGLIQFEEMGETAALLPNSARSKSGKWIQHLMRPLAMRFPLIDPERFLDRTLSVVQPGLSRSGIALWLIVITAGVVLCVLNWPSLIEHWSARGTDPINLLLLALAYPFVKAVHELGHAYATKAWGGEVHEMGIMLLVFMPVPYVDASAANMFSNKYKRMAVSGAGIMVELFLAALAMLVWVNIQPGLIRDIAFNVALIGGASTLLFNGNPLMRFDGYYILSDAIEMPNLASRSRKYIGYCIKRYCFGLASARSPLVLDDERAWLVIYGVASTLYRFFICIVIALFIAGKYFFIGILLAILVMFGQLLLPVARQLKLIVFGEEFKEQRLRAILVAGSLSVLTLLVIMVPVSSGTYAQGVIRLPEQAVVRAGADGIMMQIPMSNGDSVQKGQVLFALEDPFLQARVSILEGKLRELIARYDAEIMQDPMQAEIYREEVKVTQAELNEARARLGKLMVYSQISGTLIVPLIRDLPGRYVHKGDVLAYVTDDKAMTARVVVPQTAADLVRHRTQSVEVRLAHRPADILPARIDANVPSATRQLPSRALGSQGGGAIAVDARDDSGVMAIDQFFQFDIEIPLQATDAYVGSRVFVRFNHGRESLARQWLREVRQLFLARLQF